MELVKQLRTNIMCYVDEGHDSCSDFLVPLMRACDSLKWEGISLARYVPDPRTEIEILKPTRFFEKMCPEYICPGTYANEITYNPPLKNSIVRIFMRRWPRKIQKKEIILLNRISVFPQEKRVFDYDVHMCDSKHDKLVIKPSCFMVPIRSRKDYMEEVEDELPFDNEKLNRLQRLTKELNLMCLQ
jgi:hypothetical protein